MRYVMCLNKEKCGVDKHLATTTHTRCGATAPARVLTGGTLMSSGPRPVRRGSFPVTRERTLNGEIWEFPVAVRGGSHFATVASERGSEFLRVTIAEGDREFAAQVLPSEARGGVPGAILVTTTHEGRPATVTRIRAVQAPGSAETVPARVQLLEDDANWIVESSRTMEGMTGLADDGELPATDERAQAVAKAVRLRAVISVARATMRERAIAASMAQQDAESRASFERYDADLNAVLAASRLSLETITV